MIQHWCAFNFNYHFSPPRPKYNEYLHSIENKFDVIGIVNNVDAVRAYVFGPTMDFLDEELMDHFQFKYYFKKKVDCFNIYVQGRRVGNNMLDWNVNKEDVLFFVI